MTREKLNAMTPEEQAAWRERREKRYTIIASIVTTILIHAVLYRLGL